MVTKHPDIPKPVTIRKVREAAGISQTEAASIVYVSLRTWQNWEAGKHNINPMLWDCFKQIVRRLPDTQTGNNK